MSLAALPEGLEPGMEAEIEWERDDTSATVTVELNGVTIMVDVPYDKVDTAPWLVAALPDIMAAAWDAIEQEDS